MKHIVLFSGGVGSWMAAKRVAEFAAPKDIILLFTDTLIEDQDLYRFLIEAAADIGGQLVWIKEGRNPWEVFFDRKRMGSPEADPCSMVLKRELADQWIESRFKPHEVTCYVGIDWSEINRFEGGNRISGGRISIGLRKRKLPYIYMAPMADPPYLSKNQMIDELKKAGIEPPRLYAMGFPHNNCGGFCVKAGQAHFKLLLKNFPERYKVHESKEQEFRNSMARPEKGETVRDVSILRDRKGGPVKTLTLRQHRLNIQASEPIDELDFGGCGCFIVEN
jgi:hypothetical protein